MIQNNKQLNGFTLIELILVVAMIGIIAFFGITFDFGFVWRTDLNQAEYLTVTSLRRAQILAQTQTDDIDWGVHFEGNQLILFQGNNFVSRNFIKDEEYDLGSVVVSASNDVVYQKFSGQPYVDLSEIQLTAKEDTIILTINEEGIINY